MMFYYCIYVCFLQATEPGAEDLNADKKSESEVEVRPGFESILFLSPSIVQKGNMFL